MTDESQSQMILATQESEDEEDTSKDYAKLISLNPKFEDIVLREKRTTLGRDAKASVTIRDRRISSRHCEILIGEDTCVLKDTSTNGTFLNRKKIGKGKVVTFHHGDEIALVLQLTRNRSVCTECCAFLFQDLRRPRGNIFVQQMKLSTVYKKYDVLNQLGSGAFRTVWKTLQRSTKRACAMKAIDKKKFEGLGAKDADSMIFREVQLMSNLSHPNIVDILDVFETPRYVTIALELCTGGDLSDLLCCLQKKGECMSESIARVYFRQILSALKYLHNNHVAHRDLKPENVMLKRKIKNLHMDVPILKLADFGLARATGSRGMMTTFCGTPYYVAPEVIEQGSSNRQKSEGYSSSVDMWSAGVMLFEMLTGTRPFEETRDGRTLFQKISCALRHDFRVCVPKNRALSNSATDLLNGLLRRVDGMIRRRSHRMSASECLEHVWMNPEKRKRSGGSGDRREKELKRHKTALYKNDSPTRRRKK